MSTSQISTLEDSDDAKGEVGELAFRNMWREEEWLEPRVRYDTCIDPHD